MKVLIISTLYPNSKIYLSGVFVHEQVKELIKLGIEVTVIAPVPFTPFFLQLFNDRWKLYRQIPSFEKIEDVNIYHPQYVAVPNGYFKNYWAYALFYGVKPIIKKLSDFDLIHVQGSAPEDYTAYLISKRLNIPYVLTVHGDSVYNLYKYSNRFRNSKKAIENAAAVIGVSTKVIDRIKRLTSRRDKLYVILNGFASAKIFDNKVSNKDGNLNILFVGTLVERKGSRYLIEAFSKLFKKFPKVNLTIAGGGELLDEMKNFVSRLGINDRTILTGALPHNEVMKLMTQCDIFAMPSWDEAFGVVYLEAMSLKKPVIACKDEGIADVVSDGVEGMLVNPRDVNSILEKLIVLIENEKLRNDMGEKGYQKIKDLTWKNNALKTLEIYNKVLNNSF